MNTDACGLLPAIDMTLPPDIESAARRLVEMLRGEATRYLDAASLPDIRLETATIIQVTDPANGLAGFAGEWRNHHHQRVGQLIFNSDGSYYAEYDLCVGHPSRAGWFVEAVTAWGRDGQVKAEARLLPAL